MPTNVDWEQLQPQEALHIPSNRLNCSDGVQTFCCALIHKVSLEGLLIATGVGGFADNPQDISWRKHKWFGSSHLVSVVDDIFILY